MEITEKEIERFWSKVDIKEENDCWNWLGATNKKGLGTHTINRKGGIASRIAYILSNSDVKPKDQVKHVCENKLCCNPKHLYLNSEKSTLIIEEEFINKKFKKAVDRFWKKVDKKNEDSCWEWTSSFDGFGYGTFRYLGKNIRSHRFSYELYYGTINDGLCVLHHCDNPKCVNPLHLFLGTKQDNYDDMVSKGRDNHASGIKNGNAKLNDETVFIIRNRYANNEGSLKSLSEEFGVDKSIIQDAVRGKTWKTVGGPLTPKGVKSIEVVTPIDVENIRNLYATKRYSERDLVEMYNIGITTIQCILSGKTWKNVPGPIYNRISNTGNPKTNYEEVKKIRKLYEEGYDKNQLSEIFNLKPHTIYHIISGRTWKNHE